MRLFSSPNLLCCAFYVLIFLSFPLYSAEFTVDTTDDAIDSLVGDGLCKTLANNCSLRAAVMESNALAGADKINLPAGTFTLTIGNTGEDKSAEGGLDILDDVSIEGSKNGITTINGNNTYIIFSILAPASQQKPEVILKNLRLTEGLQNPEKFLASAVLNFGILTMDNVTVENAGAGNFAVTSVNAYMEIINSRINDNDRAIMAQGSLVRIENSDIKRNNSSVNFIGAGISSKLSRVFIHNTNIENNTSFKSGAGIAALDGSVFNITQSHIVNNSAIADANSPETFGGGLYFSNSNLYVSESFIKQNSATYSGGGIWFVNGNFTLDKTEVSDNTANERGGGILYVGSKPDKETTSLFKITESRIFNNQSILGGGVSVLTSGRSDNITEILGTEISENTAEFGGGIAFFDNGKLTVSNSTISSNQSTKSGGGIYIETTNSTVNILSSTLHDNSANFGANLFKVNSNVSLSNSIISNGQLSTNCNVTVNSQGYNLSSDNSCGLSAELNDIIANDTLLDALQDNGGLTRTHALLDTSPAIDAGSDVVCQSLNYLDQRNYYRGNSQCDIGAFESNASIANTGEIQFMASTKSVFENEGITTFTVKRLNGSEGRVSVNVFATTQSTAVYGDDFIFNPLTVIWEDGDSEDKILTVQLVDDADLNNDRAIVIAMNQVTGNAKLAAEESLTVKLVDDEASAGQIEFSQSEFIVREGDTTAEITLSRTQGISGDIDFVIYSEAYGEIRETIRDQQVSFTLRFNIAFAEDNIFDGDQKIEFKLRSVDNGASIGTLASTSLIIKDDETRPENPGTISFSRSNYLVEENQGKLTVVLKRTGGQDGDVVIDVETIDVTAQFGSDFGAKSNKNETQAKVRALFKDGETEVFLVLLIKDDKSREANETFQLLLSNPQGGVLLGNEKSSTVTIIDDDGPVDSAPAQGDLGKSKSSSGAISFQTLLILISLTLMLRRKYKLK